MFSFFHDFFFFLLFLFLSMFNDFVFSSKFFFSNNLIPYECHNGKMGSCKIVLDFYLKVKQFFFYEEILRTALFLELILKL